MTVDRIPVTEEVKVLTISAISDKSMDFLESILS